MRIGKNIEFYHSQPVWARFQFADVDAESLYVKLVSVDGNRDTDFLREEGLLTMQCKKHMIHVVRYSATLNDCLAGNDSIEFESHELVDIKTFDSHIHAEDDYENRK